MKLANRITKKVRIKDDQLKYDFMPPLLEVIERPTNRLSVVIVVSLFLLLLTAIIWACVGEIDVVVTATAKVIPSGNIKTIQAAGSGTVRKLYFAEGDAVKAGDLLVELDTEAIDFDESYLKNTIEILEAEIYAYQSISKGEPINTKLWSDPVVKNRLSLILSQEEEYLINLDIYEKAIEDLRNDLLIAQASKDANSSSRENLSLQDDVYAELLEAGGVEAQRLAILYEEKEKLLDELEDLSKGTSTYKKKEDEIEAFDQQLLLQEKIVAQEETQYRLNQSDVQSNLSITDANIQIQDLNIQKIEGEIDTLILQKKGLTAQRNTQVNGKLAELQAQLDDARYQLDKVYKNLSAQNIVSPVDGVISKIDISDMGGVVMASQALLYIVPENEPLIVEGYIQTSDIGKIELGQEVAIKLDAINYSKEGTIAGVLTYISPDALNHQELGSVYLVHVQVDEPVVTSLGNEVVILPGMTGSIEVKTGVRKIVEYFLEPITDALDGSLKQE
ncbi:HlyD family type I secretion periplasmic adaptor subunit [Eubacteriales bacterium OttesenSCG-928-K08]|nr:HlyD family type I secretion periplasmic adaptor subunit [Eubacteriales bacterium OttesenSCG-928-K08]